MKIQTILLVASAMMLIPLSAHSAVTVDQTTSRDYIMNQGFSEDTYEIVTVSKNRSLGKEYYTAKERRDQELPKIVRFFRKFYTYAEPGADDFSFYHHNQQAAPSYTDL
ncbi:hypothetical protein IJ596_07155 [bacterium]|nr:hypothetical protein [bacterium]